MIAPWVEWHKAAIQFTLLLVSFSMLNVITQAQNTQEESQRMTAVRKVYQKAIVTPTHHIEQIWKDYENFENSVSRQLVNFWFWIVIVICTRFFFFFNF